MSTFNVSCPPAMKAFVAVQVRSGLYSSASDYVWTLIRADQHWQAAATVEAQLLDGLASDEGARVTRRLWRVRGRPPPQKGLTMAPHLPPDTAVAGWLHTLGVVSRCQWDVLVFLSCHQATLLGAADLARLLGYASNAVVVALDVLESLALVERSRVSQGARLYQCRVPHTAPRREALAQLQALAAHRAGRGLIAQQLRQDRTPDETAQQAQHFLAEAQQRLQGFRQQTRVREERRQRWLKAI